MSPDLKVKEAADLLGLHPDTVRAMSRSNVFPNAYKTGKGGKTSPVRIPRQDVEDYRKKQPRASS